jgi:hypothetical protein
MRRAVFVTLFVGVALGGCVATQPATDTSNPASPSSTSSTTTSTTTTTGPLAYTPDMQPLFASDCVPCHSGSRPSGNYSMSTYANVMKDVTAGSASSRLVVWTQPNGSMYRYFSADRTGRADMVKRWVVDNKAAQTR